MKTKVFVNDTESALINYCGQFIYEVSLFINYKGLYHIVNHKYYYSDKPIYNIQNIKQITKYLEIHCNLFSAPEKWLLDNGFIEYKKPEKKKRIKKEKDGSKKNSNKQRSRRLVS